SAISEEITARFSETLAEQRTLLTIAREGGKFDLDIASPLVGHGSTLTVTPVSGISQRNDDVSEDAETYIAANPVIEAMDPDEQSATGFTPPPGLEPRHRPRKRRSAVHAAQSKQYPIAPAEWQADLQGPDEPVRPPPTVPVIMSPPSSRVPWIIALCAM